MTVSQKQNQLKPMHELNMSDIVHVAGGGSAYAVSQSVHESPLYKPAEVITNPLYEGTNVMNNPLYRG